MRYGVQIFGMNSLFTRDKHTFLKALSSAGYRFIEPCLMLEPIPQFLENAWLPSDLEENTALLTTYGMGIHSIHIFTDNILADLDHLISLAQKYGFRQFVLPCPVLDSKQAYLEAAERFCQAADLLRSAGIELLLHNDMGDSSGRLDGICCYEWLLQQCRGKVFAQPDIGWLLFGGVDPESFLWRNKAIVRSIHYKDMEQTDDGLKETGVGTGLADLAACFLFARAQELIQVVDQNTTKSDFLADMAFACKKLRSFSYMRGPVNSNLCVLDTQTGQLTKLHTFPYVAEAPNWHPIDDDLLIFNSKGKLWNYRISEDSLEQIDSGYIDDCNNDHIVSADGRQIAISHGEPGLESVISIIPVQGGTPKCITRESPSYLHGWSPDGEEIVYCYPIERNGVREADTCTIRISDGSIRTLTAPGSFNDGAEYSLDGRHIWFCSTRTGLMQCWRMNRDGSEQVQMTFSQRNNWFPHLSPDGKTVVYLSYSKDCQDPSEHIPNLNVQLRIMDFDGNNDRVLLDFFGGQGSINVNSWSQDSRRIAFFTYELLHK